MTKLLPQLLTKLEDAFYPASERSLVEVLRTMRILEAETRMIGEVTGIHEPDLLQAFEKANVQVAAALAFICVPLAEAAWANGSVSPDERAEVLACLEDACLGSVFGHKVLAYWLENMPGPKLLDAWPLVLNEFKKIMAPEALVLLRDEVLWKVKSILKSDGGFLWFFRISGPERNYLHRCKARFRPGHGVPGRPGTDRVPPPTHTER